ncbi:MAG: hypothetical protein V4632_10970 [Pseudomonadota bacterium]
MSRISLAFSDRHRVLITHPVAADVVEKLDRFFIVDHHTDAQELAPDELFARLKDKAGVLSTQNDWIDAAMIRQLRSLKVVSNMAEAYDNLDLEALTQAGIMATNAPGAADTEATPGIMANRAADNMIAAFGFGRIGGRPPNLLNPELLCDCC